MFYILLLELYKDIIRNNILLDSLIIDSKLEYAVKEIYIEKSLLKNKIYLIK
jgi:hypothetical protein